MPVVGPESRSISSASTQCEVAWYSTCVPGSQLSRHWAKASSRLERSNHSGGPSGARGKPELCRSTCSTVTAPFPLVANSGMYSATGRSTSSSPSPISNHTAPAVQGLGGGEGDVPAPLGRADRLEHDQPALPGERQLAGGERALVHLAPCPLHEVGHLVGVDAQLGRIGDLLRERRPTMTVTAEEATGVD